MKLFAFLPLLASVWALPNSAVDQATVVTSTVTSTTTYTMAPYMTDVPGDCPAEWAGNQPFADAWETVTQTFTVHTLSEIYAPATGVPKVPNNPPPSGDYDADLVPRDIDVHIATIDILLVIILVCLL